MIPDSLSVQRRRKVAKKLNVNETSFCKWFREELSEERKQQVMSAIEEIKLDRLKEQK